MRGGAVAAVGLGAKVCRRGSRPPSCVLSSCAGWERCRVELVAKKDECLLYKQVKKESSWLPSKSLHAFNNTQMRANHAP
jgi:hypothetical protein